MRILLASCLCVLAVLLTDPPNLTCAATLIVFSEGDSVATEEYPFPGTLRQAILDANAIAGPDDITFQIPGGGVRVIRLLSCLPVVTDPVYIDGYTQPGSSPNSNGVGMGDNAVRTIAIVDSLCYETVFRVAAGSTTIRGLSIRSDYDHGIILGGDDNRVEGCYIGSRGTGVEMQGSYNLIGGLIPEARNVIAGYAVGVADSLAAGGNVFNEIQGNLIGVNASGTARVPRIGGGPTVAAIGLKGTSSVIGDSTIAGRNVIVDGVNLSGLAHKVMNNFIGTDITGSIKLAPNVGTGMSVGGSGHSIGGASVGNVITGFKTNVQLVVPCTSVVVSGNYIGTDASGTVALGDSIGIWLSGAQGCVIGGAAGGAGNLISGHDIGIFSQVTHQGPRNVIRGNFIGTDVWGDFAVPNGIGVEFFNLCRDSLSGTSFESGNLISGNTGDGILVTGFQIASQGSPVIQGNKIGTDLSGLAPLPNGRHGIHLSQPNSFSPIEGVVIGGSADGEGNTIAGNDSCGIRISGALVSGTRIEGNRIGVDVLGGIDFGNGTYGICISGGAKDNVVGGSDPGEGNLITENAEGGIFVASGVRNAIRGNSIFLNVGMGIDLHPAGITANDALDVDSGANRLQNFPVITDVTPGGFPVIEGEVNGTPNMKCTLDFFASDYSGGYCDPSGHGEGQRYLGSEVVTIGASGSVPFTAFVYELVTEFDAVTATATDSTGNTSEFSACAQNTVSDAGLPAAPRRFKLYPNVPNPFNPVTTIAYDVPDGGARVNVSVFDVAGRLVTTLVNRVEQPGHWSVSWNGRDSGGQPVSSGVYFCRMTAGQFSESRKIVLLK